MLKQSMMICTNLMDMGNVCLPFNAVLSDKGYNFVDWAQIVVAITSIIMLFVVSHFNRQTLEQTQKQAERQAKQWDKDFFLKYKQQKFLEFRTGFMTITGYVDTFHRIMGPGFIGIDMFKQDKKQFVYIPVVLQEYPNSNMLALNALQETQKFIKFMKNEDLFINDVQWLYRDILSFAESFANFLTALVQNQMMERVFHKNGSKLESTPNADMRVLYLMNWPSIIRDDTRTSIVNATRHKRLLQSLPGDNVKKFTEVANTDECFYYYVCIVNGWINMWKKAIDSILLPNVDSIELSKNSDLNTEQFLSEVEEPVVIKVVPDK